MTVIAYLLTFSTHATRLPGQERGSTRRARGEKPAELIPANQALEEWVFGQLKRQPFTLDARQQLIVLSSIIQTCLRNSWVLFAAHVRHDHVHIVVGSTNKKPSKMVGMFKSSATKQLEVKKPWTERSDVRYLFDASKLHEKIHYVTHEQGPPTAMFCSLTGTPR